MTYDDAKCLCDSLKTAQVWIELKLKAGINIKDMPKFRDWDHTWIDEQAEIGVGTVVFPNCVIMGKVVIGKNCVIMPGASITGEEVTEEEKANGKPEMRLGDNCLVCPNATLLNVEAGNGVTLALPHQKYAKIGDKSVVGAVSELNRSTLGKEVKFQHHGYLGDTTVGDRTNIGAGSITANYDGKNKHKTVFGPDCSTGVNTSIIAPNEFPEGTSIAAGSIILANIKEALRELPPFSTIFSFILKFKIKPRKDLK